MDFSPNTFIPESFEAWVGGFLGPSYEVRLEENYLIYNVYERGYDSHKTEIITPDAVSWRRFKEALNECSIWKWRHTYQGEASPDATTWYVHIAWSRDEVISKGLNLYPPMFTECLRAVRSLLEGRNFA